MNKLKSSRIDWLITLAPFIIIMALAGVLFAFPDASNDIISKVRYFFGNTMGIYYLIIGRCISYFHFPILFQIWKCSSWRAK